MKTYLALVLGKLTSLAIRAFNIGAGGTWPGEVALGADGTILAYFSRKFRKGVILIAGTNGKTTTSLMVKQILEADGNLVVHNATGANLLNGIVSACIGSASWSGDIKADWGVFEVDENSLPSVISNIKYQLSNKKIIIVLLNLFRDQLDRYGEVDVIAEKWSSSLSQLSEGVTVIINADDPQIAFLGKGLKTKISYFGVDDKSQYLNTPEHATDSTFCLNCGKRLIYTGVYYSHVGVWYCNFCGEKRPTLDLSHWDSPLPGLYNKYNTLAAVSVAKALQIPDQEITKSLVNFAPAFGRQEEFAVKGKKVKIFLSKNPAGFNASLKTVIDLEPAVIVLVLNDRIPDGRDVSWIWDVDFETIPEQVKVIVSGDRVYDMGLRMKYSQKEKSKILNSKSETNLKYKIQVHLLPNILIKPKLDEALEEGLSTISSGETLYILPTYSAMLEVRKILTGRKIL